MPPGHTGLDDLKAKKEMTQLRARRAILYSCWDHSPIAGGSLISSASEVLILSYSCQPSSLS